MSRFGPDPQAFFEAVYRATAPWDIGAPQPAMAALLDAYPAREPALDVGCGAGDLALYLADRGLNTLGVDFVDEAISHANEKREISPPLVRDRLTFRVADGLHPSTLGLEFGAVLDSGFYHLFDPDACQAYVRELACVIRPGGRCYLHEFAVEFPGPNVPRAVTEAELRQVFAADQWRFLTVRDGEFLSRVAPPVPAILSCIERIGSS